jgi:hypothetical protein
VFFAAARHANCEAPVPGYPQLCGAGQEEIENMQVLVHFDDHVCADEELIRRIEGVITGTLERFGSRVLRVDAHLGDLNSDNPGDRDKVCVLEARISGSAPIRARHEAPTLAEAIHDASGQLARGVLRQIRQIDSSPAAAPARPSARSL